MALNTNTMINAIVTMMTMTMTMTVTMTMTMMMMMITMTKMKALSITLLQTIVMMVFQTKMPSFLNK